MTNKQIINELNAIKDSLSNIERCIDLFYRIQLTQGPLIEVITLMRFEKPKLHTYLKARFNNNPRFSILFELVIDHEFARKSLGLERIYVA